MEIHDEILKILEDDLVRLQSKITNPYYYVFKNYRLSKSNGKGIRLTAQGRKLLSKHTEEFIFEHKTTLTGKLLLSLDRKMSWPYFIDDVYVCFYSPEDSAWFRLYEEDLNRFVSDL